MLALANASDGDVLVLILFSIPSSLFIALFCAWVARCGEQQRENSSEYEETESEAEFED